MKKYSPAATWKNLTPFGRVFFGIIALLLIACTALTCFSSVVVIFLPVPTATQQFTPAPLPSPTFTISPSLEIQTDVTLTIFPSPSLTSLPTRQAYASSTPPIYLITPTNTFLPFPLPSSTSTPTRIPRNKSVCSCRIDKYDCGDFLKQAQAQACFNFCFSLGAGDIHNLDPDHDGLACNGLP